MRTPEAVAVVFEEQQLTYGQLEERANQLAHHLRGLGVGPEVVVGLCVERSLQMVVGLLGILKAGGAYLPLDPSYPPERLAFMLEDSRAPVLLTQSSLVDELPAYGLRTVELDTDWPAIARQPASAPPDTITPPNTAYVIYTSGSTGIPKGIVVDHRNIVRLVRETNYVTLTADDVVLQLAPLAFDASTFEIWGALLNGATLAVYADGAIDLPRLRRVIEQQRVSVLWLTATLFQQVVDEDVMALAGVRQLLAGGDIVSVPHVRRVMETLPGCVVINGYGPTEATTFSTTFTVADTSALSELAADWTSTIEHAGLCVGRGLGASPGRGSGGALHRRRGAGAGLFAPRRADGGAVCCQPVWYRRQPDVPHRGFGALAL